jgi:hypothetical protein
MQTYQLYILGRDGGVVSMVPLRANDDPEAIQIGLLLASDRPCEVLKFHRLSVDASGVADEDRQARPQILWRSVDPPGVGIS